MKWLRSPAVRISLGLVLLTVSLVLAADMLGLVPDDVGNMIESRRKFCESLAVQCSLAAQTGDLATVETTLDVVVERNDDILSAGLRRPEGELMTSAGEHESLWPADGGDDKPSPSRARVPIFRDNECWATVEVRFQNLTEGGLVGLWARPVVRLVAFLATAGFVAYLTFLRKTLKALDPTQVVPGRVHLALDALAEGVVLLDRQGDIVLANAAFQRLTDRKESDLMGRRLDELSWTVPRTDRPVEMYPWRIDDPERHDPAGQSMTLDNHQTFMVKATPIRDDKGHHRGTLATFDDLTQIEETNDQLKEMLRELAESRNAIRRQNRELQVLATRDPLTGCLNRRSFFERFEAAFESANRYGHSLACMMIDLDNFKSVNDRYGHSVGDQVLRGLGDLLREIAGESEEVCRYGGEEFCVLLPHHDIAKAVETAERIREAVSARQFAGLEVSVSAGVSALAQGSRTIEELLDRADKALYVAKNTGRNRVIRWNAMIRDCIELGAADAGGGDTPTESEQTISSQTVSSLMHALAHRDAATAEHGRQVATLCVAAADGMMSSRQIGLLEVAGQLHDIGKLGVPDTILFKNGPLTEAEWETMRDHQRRGVEMIASSLKSPELTEIVRTSHAWFDGHPRDDTLPAGEDIPAGARLLAIADAFCAMISHRPYARTMSPEEAFDELRRCAPRQFDPVLVERFVDAVTSRNLVSQMQLEKASRLALARDAERLTMAVHASDIDTAVAIAGRIAESSRRLGLKRVAVLASQLSQCAMPGRCASNKLRRLADRLSLACFALKEDDDADDSAAA